MRSFGIDNIEFRLSLGEYKLEEVGEQLHGCPVSRNGWLIFVYDCLHVKLLGNVLIVNMNVPKLLRTENVWLADRQEVCDAVARFERLTSLSVRDSDVTGLHITYTQDIETTFQEFVSLFSEPRRYNRKELEDGVYFNSDALTLLVYDKRKQLAATRVKIPRECRELHEVIARIELRVNKRLRKQLKEFAGWDLPSFRVSDLQSDSGFRAIRLFFERRLSQFLPPPNDARRNKVEQSPSAYLSALPSMVGKANPKLLYDYALRVFENGLIESEHLNFVREGVERELVVQSRGRLWSNILEELGAVNKTPETSVTNNALI